MPFIKAAPFEMLHYRPGRFQSGFSSVTFMKK